MELTAPIVGVDSGVGSLCQQWLSSMEVAVGWSQRRQSLSLMVAMAVFVDNGHCHWRRRWDGADGTNSCC